MRRPIAIAASLTLIATLSLVAQGSPEAMSTLGAQGELAVVNRTGRTAAMALVDRAVLGALLKPAYALHLVSDWPQYGIAGTTCVNGGNEVLTGRLLRTSGGNYTGTLERQTTIRFCGSHGAAQGEACSLTLTSHGPVAAQGEVVPLTGARPSAAIAIRWAAPAGLNAADVAIEGDCAPAFTTSLRELYLGVSHALEFPLPLAGEAASLVRLEQGWIVEVK